MIFVECTLSHVTIILSQQTTMSPSWKLNDYIDRYDHYLANGQFQEALAYCESTLERRNMLRNEQHVWRAKCKLALVEYKKAKREMGIWESCDLCDSISLLSEGSYIT